MVPGGLGEGAGGIADGPEVRAVVIDDGRDDPVSQMDDERRPRIESGDLAEKGPEGPVVVGDRVPDDDEPQISSIILGRDPSRGFAVGRDDAPELVGDGAQLGVFPEPGQVISPVSEGVRASAHEKGYNKSHIYRSLSEQFSFPSLNFYYSRRPKPAE